MNQSPAIHIDDSDSNDDDNVEITTSSSLQNNVNNDKQQQQQHLQPQPQSSSDNVSRTLSTTNVSRVSSRLDHTFKIMATRLQIASKLSMAKRKENNLALASNILLDDSNVSHNISIKKFRKEMTPFLLSKQQSKDVTNENENIVEGIVSTGNLQFDIDYPLSTSMNDSKKVFTRPYIYLTSDVDVKSITDIMFNEWHLTMPRIALFLLSDPDHFRTWNNSRQMSSFRTGVMKAARTTSMWLVTNGLDVGVGKLIGDALIEEQNEMNTFRFEKTRKHFPIIGITNDNNLSYTQEFAGANIQLTKSGSIPNQNRYELNPLHTNFLILKQTTTNSNEFYNNLMINLIDHLTKRRILSPEHHQQQPQDENIDDNQYSSYRTTYIPSSGDYNSRSSIRPKQRIINYPPSTTVRRLSQQRPSINNLDIIVRPSYGQKTSCFNTEQQDQDNVDGDSANDSDDNKFDEDQHSFISPEGTVIYEDDISGARPLTPSLEMDSAATLITPSKAKTLKDLANEKMIPIVCLVIQGDYNCAKLVLDNIRRRNPVIVLRGSGGFADLLSYVYIEMQHRCRDLYSSWDVEFVEQTLKPLLVQKIVKHFPLFRNNIMARNTFRDRIIECVRESVSAHGRIYLTILNMHNSSCDLTNLSEFILLSLFKSQHRQKLDIDTTLIRKDLYLTLDWNCPIVALDEVISRNPSYNLQLEKSIFELALLKSNREDFVDLFLTYGFKIHKYLTPYRLIRLIRYSLLESDFFRSVCMESILGVPIWSDNFDELLERLASTNYDSNIDPEKFISNEFNQLILTTTSLNNFVCPQDLCFNIMGMYKVDAGSSERKSLAILAMWAVFNHRFKLAEILWKHSDQPIHLGLILSMILDRMRWFVSEQNVKDELQKQSKIFSQFAIDVLDLCYRNDEQRGYDMLDQKNSDWDQQTAVDIAANGSHRSFIAHPCCQKWLTNTFNGRIRVRELTWGFITIPPVMKILLSAFLILPMYIWIRFLNVNNKFIDEHKKKLLEELNDDDNDDDDIGEQYEIIKDGLEMMPLNSNHKSMMNNENDGKKSSSVLEQLFDNNQLTLMSLDDDFRAAIQRLSRKRRKQQQQHQDGHDGRSHNRNDDQRQRSRKSSSYNRERNNLFINKQPPLFRMIYLLWNSPITKFWTYNLFYIVYLALLSLALIWPGCGEWRLDLIVCIWTFLNIIEHVGRVYVLYHRYTSLPMFFRVMEVILLIIFWLTYTWGRVLIVYSYSIHGHLFSRYNIDPYGMKVIMSAGLLYFYYRLFYIYLPISPTLGPLLYRFRLMVSIDFIHFMRMALILLISSGIIIQALLYPNTELSRDTFHKAFHRSIVSLFTTPVDELTRNCTVKKPNPAPMDIDNKDGDPLISVANLTSIFLQTVILGTESLNEPINREELCPVQPIPMSQSCPVSGFWSYAFTFQFLICLKLILMTLLYALFASTATKLQTETDNIWKFQRYILVVDFANRPSLAAPLSIFKYLYVLLRVWYDIMTFPFQCCHRCKRRKKRIGASDMIDSSGTKSPGIFNMTSYDNDNDNMMNGDDDDDGDDLKKRLTIEDYNYWRHLARTIYDEQQQKESEKKLLEKQSNYIELILEELEHEKNIVRTIKTKMNEFERMMYHVQIYMEKLKHSDMNNQSSMATPTIYESLMRQKRHMNLNNVQSQTMTNDLHHLSRLSPYSGTKIQRFPVADKYVSWDIIWINYDPIIYSRKKENFPTALKNFVDEDLLAVKERLKSIAKLNNDTNSLDEARLKSRLPVFNWNAVSVNPAGLTIDRRSWIKDSISYNWDYIDCTLSPNIMGSDGQDLNKNYTIYKLDEDSLPMNICGRTGLRGKGNLPRWGPNHYVMLLLTRTRIVDSFSNHQIYEFALERKYNKLFIPIKFIGDELKFDDDFKKLFRQFDQQTKKWNSSGDIVEYFQSIDEQINHTIPSYASYMDSPDNTDNAWKEVLIYHFHFNNNIDYKLTNTMIDIDANNNDNNTSNNNKKKLSWIIYNEDMLIQMPMEQVQFIDNIILKINQWNNNQ